MRRNCSDLDMFKNQANVLRQRFLDKGYNQGEVDLELHRVSQIEHGSLLVDKPRQDPNDSFKWSRHHFRCNINRLNPLLNVIGVC